MNRHAARAVDGAVAHHGGHVGVDVVDRAGTGARGGDAAAGLLRDGCRKGAGHGVGLDPAARDGLDQEARRSRPGATITGRLRTDSTSASTSATIVLTAIATPAEIAVALPLPPLAIASDRPPAMAKMSESSVARTRTSLGEASGQRGGSCCRPCGRWSLAVIVLSRDGAGQRARDRTAAAVRGAAARNRSRATCGQRPDLTGAVGRQREPLCRRLDDEVLERDAAQREVGVADECVDVASIPL